MPQQPQGLVYPSELNVYTMEMTRHDGTLEVLTADNGIKQVLLRQFTPGQARILMAKCDGTFIRDIANFEGQEGNSTFDIGTDTAPGTYLIYLVVNGKVMHLQELSL